MSTLFSSSFLSDRHTDCFLQFVWIIDECSQEHTHSSYITPCNWHPSLEGCNVRQYSRSTHPQLRDLLVCTWNIYTIQLKMSIVCAFICSDVQSKRVRKLDFSAFSNSLSPSTWMFAVNLPLTASKLETHITLSHWCFSSLFSLAQNGQKSNRPASLTCTKSLWCKARESEIQIITFSSNEIKGMVPSASPFVQRLTYKSKWREGKKRHE